MAAIFLGLTVLMLFQQCLHPHEYMQLSDNLNMWYIVVLFMSTMASFANVWSSEIYFQPNETWTKWSPFSSWDFDINVLQRINLDVIYIALKFVCKGSINRW